MARMVNEAAYAARRNAILDAAERAVETTGYEQMGIADLLGELQISSGAFYHYFDSKPALLSALVERMGERIEQLVLPIVHDRELGALDKLQRFFGQLMDEHLHYLQEEFMGFLQQLPGYRGGFWLVDRLAGDMLSFTVWASREDLLRAGEQVRQRGQQRLAAGGKPGAEPESVELFAVWRSLWPALVVSQPDP